jgi:GGDEF domain-containing protein
MGAAGAAVPVVPVVPPPAAATSLTQLMPAVRLPAAAPLDPDALWANPDVLSIPPAPAWELHAGERWLGRVTLAGVPQAAAYVLAVPMPQVDDVRVWWRVRGQAWHAARAGDLLALSRWPFANTFPAFSLEAGPQPVDVIVAVANAAYLRVPVTLSPDAEFRENIVRRANLSGVMMGLGGMIMIVCLLGGLTYGGRARWLLAGVSVWLLFTISANNGYLAVWLTGEWPALNDALRSFTAVTLAGLVVLLVSEALDPLHVRPLEHALGLAAAVLAPAYAVAQMAWLPTHWRVPGAVAAAALAIVCGGVLCALNALRGGRRAGWPAGALVAFFATPVLVVAAPEQVAGLDLRAAAVAASTYAALMLLREALMRRDRHGRDVLGRAAVSASRDPLTALWSYEGFEQRHAEAGLREAAGQGTSSMLLLLLPGLDGAVVQHGTSLTERTLVRFAAALQQLLGQHWAVARLSQTRFAAISLRPLTDSELADTATQVLAHCGRVSQPLNLVAEFDLRIATSQCPLSEAPLPELLRQLKQLGLALAPGKRIVHMGAVPAFPLGEAGLSKP